MMRILIIILVLIFTWALAGAQDAPLPEGADVQGEEIIEETIEDEAPSPFFGHPAESIWTVIAFAVLLFVLWKLAWKPLLHGLHARENHIAKQITDAEKTRHEADGVLAKYRDKLADVEEEGKKIIQTYTGRAEKEAREIVVRAQEDAAGYKQRMQEEMERARKIAEEELLEEAGVMVMQLGEEILGRAIQPEDQEKLISDAIEQLRIQSEAEKKV